MPVACYRKKKGISFNSIARVLLRYVKKEPAAVDNSRYFRDSGDAAIDSLFFSLADHLATRGSELDMPNWRQHAAIVDYVLAQRAGQQGDKKTPRLISGHDLMQGFDLSPGPQVGRLLSAVDEAFACREVTTREEALAYAGSLLSEEEGDKL